MVQVRNCFFVLRCQPDERETIHLLAANRGVSASGLIKGLIADEASRQVSEGLIEIAGGSEQPAIQQQDEQEGRSPATDLIEGKITKDEYIKIIMNQPYDPNKIGPDLRAKRGDSSA